MPRGTIDWKSTDSYTRLLAAMVAAQDMKLNYKKIADMYGDGATYDSIEGRFRIIRKEAEKLKTEIDSGVRAPAPPRHSGSGPSPRKARSNASQGADGVINGRVTKSSPSKRRSAAQTKREMLDSASSLSNSDESVVEIASNAIPFNTSYSMTNENAMESFDMSSFDPSSTAADNMSFMMDGDGFWAGNEDVA